MKLTLQSEASECGLACLVMIANYHGKSIDLSTLRKSNPVSLRGTTLRNIKEMAEKSQFDCRALRVNPSDLSKVSLPCVLHWDDQHFVVLHKINTTKATVLDPARGKLKLTRSELEHHYSGVLMELRPALNFIKSKPKKNGYFKSFVDSFVGLRRSIVKLLLLSFFLQILFLLAPYYSQLIIDEAVSSFDSSMLTIFAMLFSFVLVVRVSTDLIRGFYLLSINSSITQNFSFGVFKHLLSLPLSYFEKRHQGDVISRFNSVSQIRELLTTKLVEGLVDGILTISVLAILFTYSAKISLVILAFVAVYTILRLATFSSFQQQNESSIIAKAKEQSTFMESLRAIQTIKANGLESVRFNMWSDRLTNFINEDYQVGRLQLLFRMANSIIFGLENIIVIYLCALLLLSGDLSVGMVFAFVAYKAQFSDRVTSFIDNLMSFKLIRLHFDRLADILDTKRIDRKNGFHNDWDFSGQVKLRNLSFRYSSVDPLIFRNINATIEPNEFVAIVGKTGCGKSTLLKVMMSLMSPNSGQIEMDGFCLSDISDESYRSHIASVLQEDELLSGTIAENICSFSNEVDLERLHEAARASLIDDDIRKMPMGYNSLVGDMGSSLSGGQKQRLLLARALYREPKILFLDEATSHLDVASEILLNQAISNLDITRIVVAHRPHTVIQADRILRLDHDQISDVTKEYKARGLDLVPELA